MYYTTQNPGDCILPTDYWNNATVGCPCNGTWTTGIVRVIPGNLSKCDVCPGRFFFQDYVLYGNIRFTNVSNNPKIEITKTSTDEPTGHGYGVADVKYVFVRDPTQPCSGAGVVAVMTWFVVVMLLN